jgi:hypothetical protein
MSAPSIFIEGNIVAIKSDGVRVRALSQATREDGCDEPGEERSARRRRKIRDLRLPVRRKMLEGSRMPAYIQKYTDDPHSTSPPIPGCRDGRRYGIGHEIFELAGNSGSHHNLRRQ